MLFFICASFYYDFNYLNGSSVVFHVLAIGRCRRRYKTNLVKNQTPQKMAVTTPAKATFYTSAFVIQANSYSDTARRSGWPSLPNQGQAVLTRWLNVAIMKKNNTRSCSSSIPGSGAKRDPGNYCTRWLILLAMLKFPFRNPEKPRILNWPPSEITKSRTCHPPKMVKSRTYYL